MCPISTRAGPSSSPTRRTLTSLSSAGGRLNGADAMMSVKSISTAAQLKGQSVAYEFGTTSDLLLHYFLLEHHMSFNSVKSVNVPAADAGTLLIAGKDKVVVTYQPYISEATSGPERGRACLFFQRAGPRAR